MSALHFSDSAHLPSPLNDVFSWHQRRGALTRLTPPWSRVRTLQESHELNIGDRVRVQIGPITFESVHTELELPHNGTALFADQIRRGPVKHWYHRHIFESTEEGTRVGDEIDLSIPWAPNTFITHQLRRAAAYRYRQLTYDLAQHARTHRTLCVAITGASGLIGRQLSAFLTSGGHSVRHLVRTPPSRDDEIFWNPERGEIEKEKLRECDAVVHLAAEPLYGRWTHAKMREIRESRVRGTALLAHTLAELHDGPQIFVSVSAVGIYGHSEDLTHETSPRGSGFLADVVSEWEAAAQPARDAGIRVVHPRLGVVLTPRGGLLAQQLPLFLAGVGGPVGNGTQWLSWVSEGDAIGLLHHALITDVLEGPLNATAPEPVQWREFSSTLGDVLKRPARVRTPLTAIRVALGSDAARELATASQRAVPTSAAATGYSFQHTTLEPALRHVLGSVF